MSGIDGASEARRNSASSFKDNRTVDSLYIQFELRNDGDKTNVPDPEPLNLSATKTISETRLVQPDPVEEQPVPKYAPQPAKRSFLGRRSRHPPPSTPPAWQPQSRPQPKQVVTTRTIPRLLGTYVDSVVVCVPFRLKAYTSNRSGGGGSYDSDYVSFAEGLLDFVGEDLRAHLFPSAADSSDGLRDGSQCWSEAKSSVNENDIVQVPGMKQTWKDGSGPFKRTTPTQPARRSSTDTRRGSMDKTMFIERTPSIPSVRSRSSTSSVKSDQRRTSYLGSTIQPVQYHVEVGQAARNFTQSWQDTYTTGYSRVNGTKKNGYNCVIPFTFSARKPTGEKLGFSPEALKRIKISAICHMLRMCESTKVRVRSATITSDCVYEMDLDGCKWENTSKQLALYRKNSDSS